MRKPGLGEVGRAAQGHKGHVGVKPHLLAPELKRPSSRGRRRKGTQAQGRAARKGIGAVVTPRWPITQCPGSSLAGLSRPSRQCQQRPLHLSLIPVTALGPFGQKQRWQKRRLSSGPKRRRQGARAPALGSGLVCFPSGLLVCRPELGMPRRLRESQQGNPGHESPRGLSAPAEERPHLASPLS